MIAGFVFAARAFLHAFWPAGSANPAQMGLQLACFESANAALPGIVLKSRFFAWRIWIHIDKITGYFTAILWAVLFLRGWVYIARFK